MKRLSKRFMAFFLAIVLVITSFGIYGITISAATTDIEYSPKYLQNGSFEDLPEDVITKIRASGYTQPAKDTIPYWDTTAYGSKGNNGQFEFFGAKTNGTAPPHFEAGIREVADGDFAAELNADEETTMFQRIETVSGSTYTWGLDHRGRSRTDRMVLFIGPDQENKPAKPRKDVQNGAVYPDQFVRITDWLKTQYGVDYPNEGCSRKYTVYTRPFAANGRFKGEPTTDIITKKINSSTNKIETNDTNIGDYVSLTQTEECTEEWNLWVISSSNNNTSTEDNKAYKGWSKYGTNRYDENADSYNDVINGAGSKLGYDCTYTVPKGQTKTLFAFTSLEGGRASASDATYGNLLDDINFKLYQPISSSITPGGSGGVEGGKVTVSGDVESDKLFADVTEDGKVCKIYTAKSSADDKYKFVGAYITETANNGTESTRYVSICHHDLTGLTKEEIEAEHASVGFVPYKHDENVTDDTKWDYYFILKVNNPVHIHMIYTKAPYVIYDSNGGLPYQYGPNNESGNDSVAFGDGYYTGSPETESYYKNSYYKFDENDQHNTIKEKGYYYSHTAYDNPNWKKNLFNVGAKFVGWSVLGTDNNMHVFDANHKIEYMPIDAAGGSITIFDVDENGNPKENANAIELALDENDGATLTAQWKFGYTAQAQTLTGHSLEEEEQEYINSAVGGTVSETFIDNRSDVEDHTDAEGRVERTDAYGSVGSKIIFRATPDAANNYVFDGWYKIKDGKYTLITTTPNLAITVEQGNSEAYYARFKTKTVPVVFYYSPTGSKDDYDYYDKNANNKYGKYFQDVVYNASAIQPTDDSKSVTMWFTSPTERSAETMFDFDTPITEKTYLYASPSFTFNYTNYFRIKEPWELETYCTLRFDRNYIDLKTDTKISDYNVYVLKGESVDELSSVPSADSIKNNSNTSKSGKNTNSQNILFDKTTKSGKTFNRVGAKYDHSNLFEMKKPVWVMFDFTYKGIKYTTPVKNRSLYNNIDIYKQSDAEKWFSTLPANTQSEMRNAQITLVDSIKNMYYKVSASGVTEDTNYNSGVSVSGLEYDSTTDGTYKFTSSTAIRNIEPWGLKYTFSVDGSEMSSFADYGAVVFTDKNDEYSEMTVLDLINNENSVMFSSSSGNVYTNKDDSTKIDAYYINNMSATEFGKKTYVVFFVKDNNGNCYYSSIVNNCYNDLAAKDNENTEVSNSIIEYSNALVNYFTLRNNAANQIA